jgi:hypothetical protein
MRWRSTGGRWLTMVGLHSQLLKQQLHHFPVRCKSIENSTLCPSVSQCMQARLAVSVACRRQFHFARIEVGQKLEFREVKAQATLPEPLKIDRCHVKFFEFGTGGIAQSRFDYCLECMEFGMEDEKRNERRTEARVGMACQTNQQLFNWQQLSRRGFDLRARESEYPACEAGLRGIHDHRSQSFPLRKASWHVL